MVQYLTKFQCCFIDFSFIVLMLLNMHSSFRFIGGSTWFYWLKPQKIWTFSYFKCRFHFSPLIFIFCFNVCLILLNTHSAIFFMVQHRSLMVRVKYWTFHTLNVVLFHRFSSYFPFMKKFNVVLHTFKYYFYLLLIMIVQWNIQS